MKFNHLNVPSHWQNYWTRYPEGHTILEALISWVSQVDEMVDNVNNWNTYLDDFVLQFDTELHDTLTTILTDWQISGFLDEVITNALQWDLDNYKAKNDTDIANINQQLLTLAGSKANADQVYDKQTKIGLADLQPEVLSAVTGTNPVNVNSIPEARSVTIDKIEPTTLLSLADTIRPVTVEVGTINASNGTDGPTVDTRLRTRPIRVYEGDLITVGNEELDLSVTMYIYNADGSFSRATPYTGDMINTVYHTVRFVFSNLSDNTTVISGLMGTITKNIRIYPKEQQQQMNAEVNKRLTFNNTASEYFTTGKNKFNRDEVENGYLNSDGSLDPGTPQVSYATNKEYIKVKAGNKVSVTQGRKILLYDVNMTPYFFIDNADHSAQSFTVEKDGWLRVSVATSRLHNAQVEFSDAPTSYEAYSRVVKYQEDLSSGVNQLSGKIVLNLGDSIASPSSVNNQRAYAHIITQQYGMALYSKSEGGATMADTRPTRSFILQQFRDFRTENPTVTPDYILVNGMTNDILYSPAGTVTAGHADNMDTLSFCGGFEELIRTIKKELPSSKILYVFAHQMNTRDYDKQTEYHSKGVQMLNKWSVPYVDLFEEGGLNTMLEEMRIFTDAGTHPNEEGYLTYYVPPIVAKLKAI